MLRSASFDAYWWVFFLSFSLCPEAPPLRFAVRFCSFCSLILDSWGVGTRSAMLLCPIGLHMLGKQGHNAEEGHSCFGSRALMRTDGFFSFLFFVPRSPTSKIWSPFLQFLFLDFGFLGSGDSAMLLCPFGLFVFLGDHLILRRGSRVISPVHFGVQNF
jgi:hypothetical protein